MRDKMVVLLPPLNDYLRFGLHFHQSLVAFINRTVLRQIELQSVKGSDTTNDDSSNAVGQKKILNQ